MFGTLDGRRYQEQTPQCQPTIILVEEDSPKRPEHDGKQQAPDYLHRWREYHEGRVSRTHE